MVYRKSYLVGNLRLGVRIRSASSSTSLSTVTEGHQQWRLSKVTVGKGGNGESAWNVPHNS